MKNKNLTYESKIYEVVMPNSDEVRTVTLNKLKNKIKDLRTPKTKLVMPKQFGFFRGVEYTEQDTLVEYNDNTWEKLVSIKFGDGADALFGTNKIEKVDTLDETDVTFKDTVLNYNK